MYPQRELNRLAVLKASLQAGIALRRIQCAEAIVQVSAPLEWLDRVANFWREFAPLIKITAIPLGLLAKRALPTRFKMLGALARWGPLAYGAFRGLRAVLDPARP
jgi:hypothetical protein